VRELRADAQRNRSRILQAAAIAFAESGLEVGVAEIARRAEVGTATVFRRFPTKHDLVVAVVEERVGEAVAAAEAALEDPDPWHGLVVALESAVALQVRDRGFLEAVEDQVIADPRLHALHERFLSGLDALLARAQAAGAVRTDVTALDVALLASGASHACPKMPGLPSDLWRRYLGVVLDGLSPAGATPLAARPPDPDALTALRGARPPRRTRQARDGPPLHGRLREG